MSMFKFWGSQEEPTQPRPEVVTPSQSWYPPSVVNSPTSSRPGTPSSTSSSSMSYQRPTERAQSPLHVSPAEAAGVISVLKDKSVEDLRKLLSDKNAYQQFFLSLDQVKIQNNLREELRRETLQLSRENLEKEPQMVELRNQVSFHRCLVSRTRCKIVVVIVDLSFPFLLWSQCRIIRTTELAAAQEKLNELERKKEEMLKLCSPSSLLQRLQESMNTTEEESEALHEQLLDKEVDLGAFVEKYKKLRTTYHKRALVHLAAKTSSVG
ncbi:unnamed protein product [Malus baccata var. baccata]